MGPASGGGGGAWVKHKKKSSSPKPHGPELSYSMCSNVFSGPLYKSCQPCPCGPYGPRPGGVMGKTL